MPSSVSWRSLTPLPDRGIDGRADLARFDGLFGLPPARLQVITRSAGASTRYLANGKEAGNAEVGHEVAPGAAIRVVLLPETGVIASHTEALRFAASLGTVVSVTAGAGEICTSQTGSGVVHLVLAFIAFTAITIAAILISASLMSDQSWRPAAPVLLAVSVAGALAYLLLGTAHKHHHAPGGLYERIFLRVARLSVSPGQAT